MTGLLAAGAVGPPIFALLSLLLGATRAAYDPVRTFLSQLSLNGGGTWQVANFVAVGLVIISSGLGLRRAVPSGPASHWGWPAVCVAGIGFVGIGIFRDDPWLSYPPGAPDGIGCPRSDSGRRHLFSSVVAGLGLGGAMVAFARRFAAERDIPWIAYTVAGASLFPGFYAAALVSARASNDPSNPLGGYAGFLQRLSIFTALAWVAALAGRFLLRSPLGTPGHRPAAASSGAP